MQRALLCALVVAATASTASAGPSRVAAPPREWTHTFSGKCSDSQCPTVSTTTTLSIGELGPNGEAIGNFSNTLEIAITSSSCEFPSVILDATYVGGAGLSPRQEVLQSVDTKNPATMRIVTGPANAWFSGPWKLNVQARCSEANQPFKLTVKLTASGGATSPLDVTLRAGAKKESSFQVLMTIANHGSTPLSSLAVPPLTISSGTVKVLKGPSPTPPATLRPHGKVVLTYELGVETQGKARITATASASDNKGKQHSDARAVDVEIGDLGTRLLTILGTVEQTLEVEQQSQQQLSAGLTAALPAGYAKEPAWVAGIGAKADARLDFNWVPGSTDEALKAGGYILNGAAVEIPDRVAERFKGFSITVGEGLSNAYDFWFKNLGWTPQSPDELMAQSVALTDVILNEPASQLSKTLQTAQDYYASGGAGTSTVLSHLPGEMEEATKKTFNAVLKQAQESLAGFSKEVKSDPEGAWTNFGRTASQAGVDLAITTATTVWGPGVFAKAAKIAASERLAAALGFESFEALAAETSITLEQASRVGGILKQDSVKIQQILSDLEKEYPQAGKLEFQVRPSAPESIPVYARSGIPKPPDALLSQKTITRLDVLLGADPAGLGEVGLFNPKRPPESLLKALQPDQRAELLSRLTTREKEFAEFNRGETGLNQALKPGGHDFDLGQGRQAHFEATLEKEVGGKTLQNETVLVRNKELVIDKRTIGKAGAPFASDIDGHALIKYGASKNLSSELRATLELQLKTRLEQLGVNTGGHGWTFSGFDFANAEQNAAKRARYLLEFCDPKNAAAALAELKRLNPTNAGIQALTLDGLINPSGKGKYVIKYTAENIRVGHGPI